ncbi:hypothetical protein X802_00965 [Thermococcus guaymasensis DSM 11113]|uniref:Uncharacterized protein n=1 Tax=Thermococcus guaymasensis DSM 11113 TaxID=1432656 RepID=A0A0X1KN19_9EURY|nr:hypothetical protein [Thermococcus guaymasensis]AJC72625.1 hypothetical protein X802_00965 [Thermococcus guaymasensis DSM 11113]
MATINVKHLFKWFFLSLIQFFLIFVLPFVLVWWYLRNDIQNLVLAFVMIVQLYILAFQAELSLRNETLAKLSYLPVFRVITRKGDVLYEDDEKVQFTKYVGDNPYGGIVLKNVGRFPAFNILVHVTVNFSEPKNFEEDSKTLMLDTIPPGAERLIYHFSSGINRETFIKSRINVDVTYTSFTNDTRSVAFIKPKDADTFVTFQSNKMPSFLLGIIENLSMSTKLLLLNLRRRKVNPDLFTPQKQK